MGGNSQPGHLPAPLELTNEHILFISNQFRHTNKLLIIHRVIYLYCCSYCCVVGLRLGSILGSGNTSRIFKGFKYKSFTREYKKMQAQAGTGDTVQVKPGTHYKCF